MARPYRHQIRRSRRAAPLLVETHPGPMIAQAYLRKDTIEISDDRLLRWIALHEVAHLLVPHSTRAPHYWRFVAVYAQMIERHVGAYLAGQFRALATVFEVAWGPGG